LQTAQGLWVNRFSTPPDVPRELPNGGFPFRYPVMVGGSTGQAATPRSRWEQYRARTPGPGSVSAGTTPDIAPLGDRTALSIAAILWAAPTLAHLAWQGWAGGQGAGLAVILSTAIWVGIREWPRDRRPGAGDWRVAASAIGAAALLNLAAWFAGFFFAEVLAVYVAGVALLYALGGRALCRRLWFPLVYGLAALPLPSSIMGPATHQLKLLVADASVRLLAAGGVEVARTGASIYVDQYELVIEAACSGVNSIVSLVAVGLLYGYLRHRDAPGRIVALAVAALVIAILANVVRVVVLGVLVGRYGVYLLDTPVHGATGLLMFVVAAVLLLVADAAVTAGLRLWGWLFPSGDRR